MKILINLNPQATVQQRIVLLLNEVSSDASQPPRFYRFPALPPVAGRPIEIPVSDVAPGEYVVRLQVDEVESVSLDSETKKPKTLKLRIGAAPPPSRLIATNIQLTFTGEGSAITVQSAVTVKDQNNVTVPGAQVAALWTLPEGSTQNQSQATDPGGIVRFSLPNGRGAYVFHINTINKAGYVFDHEHSRLEATIIVPALNRMRTTRIDFEVTPLNDQFSIRARVMVVDDNQNPVPGAVVAGFWNLPGVSVPHNQTAPTDSAGEAAFTATNGPGSYTLNVTGVAKTGFTFDANNSVLRQSIVAPGEPLIADDIYFEFDDRGSSVDIRGRVTIKDRTGARVEGAAVTVEWTSPDASKHLQTDDHTDGNGYAWLEFSSEQRGTYVLSIKEVSKPGFYFDQAGSVPFKTLEVPGNPLISDDISFENVQVEGPQARVPARVTVKDRTGARMQNALVSAQWTFPDGTREDQTDHTDENGYAWFEAIDGFGVYVLTVTNIEKTGYTFDSANSILSKSRTVSA